jgi:hypothetical protein
MNEGNAAPAEIIGSTSEFVIDPLESAITNTAQAIVDAEGMTLMILQSHLKKLCDLQLTQLSDK